MDKRKLQEFATWAKQNLERQIELSLKKIGINSAINIVRSRVHGEVTVIDGIETSFKREFHKEREEIINIIREDGYRHSIEQFASTWFNRLVALRFLEVHDYLDHGFKIFPKQPNTLPEIISKLSFVKEDLNLDMEYVDSLRLTGNNNEELYRYILFQQCNALGKPLPMLFASDMSYLEFFIPTPLLFGDTIINRLIEIDEKDFKEDVEIIGWLYQFYIASKKDEVFASKAKITKDTLPAVTQLFTPNWIVKYMAENSIGRIWLESYPTSPLKTKMKYFVQEAEQEPEVEQKLKEIRYKNVNPEEIKIIEPCSGSGHILVYCFDLLLEMYIEKGYSKRDIPALIFKNNLVGFDIDKRATQLASFALVMRARSVDNRFFDDGRYTRPKVYEIIDSKSIINADYNGKNYKQIINEYNNNQWTGENQISDNELKVIDYIVNLFTDAKVIGSLLKIKPYKYLILRMKLIKNIKEFTQPDLFTTQFFEFQFRELIEILRIAYYLSVKYDVMITNPPYVGITSFDDYSKNYLSREYPNSKSDMFAMFMESGFIKKNGYLSMINMHSWMFLNSYKNLRDSFINTNMLLIMLHLGAKAFEEIGGDVVQTTSFISRNLSIKNYYGYYFRLTETDKKEQKFLNNKNDVMFRANGLKFLKIPNHSFAYWASDKVMEIFEKTPNIAYYIEPKQGLATTDNKKYLRQWYEVAFNKIKFDSINKQDALQSEFKWFPYNKGGSYKKWYGNYDYIVNYKNDGCEIKEDVLKKYPYLNNPDFVVKNTDYYFRESITWPLINSAEFSVRYRVPGSIHDVSGMSAFSNERDLLFYIMAILNTNIARVIFKMLNPTVNLQVGDFNLFPVIIDKDNYSEIISIVKENISIVKDDWDLSELSWDFKRHFLVGEGKIKKLYSASENKSIELINYLKRNEEYLNCFFVNLYGLKGEVSTTVEDKTISISKSEKVADIQSLLSYFVGILFGRYSLSESGLILTSGKFEENRYGLYDVDQDGILPIYSDLSIENGLIHRITGLIKDIYGEEHYRDNINFIAETLGKKSNETSEETVNRYLNDEFYQDHLRIYKKTPIYWMLSSGKLNGFKCLIYMHRYDENTLAKINAGYFQPATMIIRNQINEIEGQILRAGDNERRILEKKRLALVSKLAEAREYGQVLDHMANKYISIDLDDGVKVNYAKFQGVEFISDNVRVKKDLLVPIK